MVLKNIMKSIKLNKLESDICQALKEYCLLFNRENPNREALSPRITGGWVRDKLMGNESHDLDIAVNNMSGEQFALGLTSFLHKNGTETHSLHKIDKNPEKSKHLETCTTKLFGISIDFVNLRSEEYSEYSRIPTVAFGTPYQDAMRRDATLNSIFYNIMEDKIEDFTGYGIEDLKNGILRTPLPPRQTFIDDPLRILRLIRFASRFNFLIEEDTYACMRDKDIHNAFDTKISRERVGTELTKILTGPNPIYALNLIQGANLSGVIFSYNYDDNQDIKHAYSYLNQHLNSVSLSLEIIFTHDLYLHELYQENELFKQNFILTIILSIFYDLTVSNPKKPTTNVSLVGQIMKESIKFPNSISDKITDCIESQDKYKTMVQEYCSWSRSEIGSLLRPLNENWELCHYACMALEFMENDDLLVLEKYKCFHEFICNQKLDKSYLLRPLLNGKELSKKIGLKAGPWIGKINNEMILWQLDNPQLGEKELLEYVKSILPRYV